MTILLYLAKPRVGGWVSFTAHLSLLKEIPIYRISKRTEKKEGQPRLRDFGYGCSYQNISLEDLLKKDEDILVTAIDKTGYEYIDKLPPNQRLVIHDPTELKAQKGYLLDKLDKFKVITIRESVKDFLAKHNITTTFLYHPFVAVATEIENKEASNNKSGTVSISRIDYDKHTEIILKANELLLDPIEIYGSKNDRYVFHKLKELDPMKELIPGSCYRGKFPKDFFHLANILSGKKFVVDLSRIKDDGGGSQYTFLEAIDYGCALILHKDWVNRPNSCFREGYNCFAISNEDELVDLLNSEPDTTEIVQRARELLAPHLEADGW